MKVQLVSKSGKNKAMCIIHTDHGKYTRHLINKDGKWFGVPAIDFPPLDKETRRPNVFVEFGAPKTAKELHEEDQAKEIA